MRACVCGLYNNDGVFTVFKLNINVSKAFSYIALFNLIYEQMFLELFTLRRLIR